MGLLTALILGAAAGSASTWYYMRRHNTVQEPSAVSPRSYTEPAAAAEVEADVASGPEEYDDSSDDSTEK